MKAPNFKFMEADWVLWAGFAVIAIGIIGDYFFAFNSMIKIELSASGMFLLVLGYIARIFEVRLDRIEKLIAAHSGGAGSVSSS